MPEARRARNRIVEFLGKPQAPPAKQPERARTSPFP
jgi:hypothetical protein